MRNRRDFWANVVKGDCWLWAGVSYRKYGRFRTKLAHRVAYREAKGEIPEGLVLDHLCKNTLCVNPQHLEPVTQGTNIARGNTGKYQSKRTHCPSGHEYNEQNTRLYRGRRYCKTCQNT